MEKIKVNNELFEYDLSIKDSLYTLAHDGTSASFQVFKYGDDYLVFDLENNTFVVLDAYLAKDKAIIWVDDQELVLEEESEENVSLGDESKENNIKSPMPGIIREVKFKEKDSVKKGDAIVVLESMKVLNDLKSSIDGIIKKINVDVGMQVGPLEILVEIEPKEEQ
ncbi:Biotin carboxyl carrier protein of acetyl-CoA carboxylase, Biotin carboxyl carrier protein [Desulfurella amilsii]|uniref:Biotin carboxyl carrier protein of acetyl-CoA carboxylase, Biotin carboxyl carrier protein n=1 Tax=Desulfurella amilsii TaxID=1562698 RepID=A0A1X4XUR0_9BACT|nr:biotin/lipoyl-containing protein [Desulfurella amilsii]OSS41248.1 Biotin carboxyl carrier protein of acetyl-CoA carboxylase, Biotin carboxyl carrier protein [Desulfurella amilsii]